MSPWMWFFIVTSPAWVALFFMIRNVWLFKALVSLSDDEILRVTKDYNHMMLRFWVWDIRKFID